MRLIRFRGAGPGGPQVGVLDEDAGTVTTLPGSPALADLLAQPVS